MYLDMIILHPVQERVRQLLGRVVIEKNLSRGELALQAQMSTNTLNVFINKKEMLGELAMKKLVKFLLKNGYTIEDIMRDVFKEKVIES